MVTKGYKFRVWDYPDGYGHQVVAGPAVYFASPNDFNDPFDCIIPVRWDKDSPELREATAESMVHKFDSALSIPEQEQLVSFLSTECDYPDYATRYNAELRKQLAKRLGVFCMSGRCESSLLWGHYANSHRGFCVEYDIRALDEHFMRTTKAAILGVAVDYVRAMPVLLPSELRDNWWSEMVKYKACEWRYEEEYRFVMYGEDLRGLRVQSIPRRAITAIRFGARMPEKHKSAIKKCIHDWPVYPALYQAQFAPDRFEIVFEPL